MNLKNIMKDVGLISVFVFIGIFLGYALRIMFARLLPQADYGLFYAVIAFFALFSSFRSLGMTESIVHFIPKYTAEKNLNKIKNSIVFVLSTQIIISLIISLAFFIFANQIASSFFHLPEAAILIKIQAATFFIIGFIEVLVSVFRGFQKPVFASLYDPLRLIFMVVFSVLLSKSGLFSLKNVFWAWFTSYLLLALFYMISLLIRHKKLFTLKLKYDKTVMKDIWSYSIPLMLGLGAQIMFARIDELILMYFKGSAEVALYEIAYPASQLMLVLVAPFSFILLPVISKMFFEKNKKSIKEILQMAYNAGLFFIAPFVLLLLVYPDLIITALFSSKYISAAAGLRVMTLGTFFLMFSNINLSVLSGMGKIVTRTKILYAIGIFSIILNVILVPKLGYMGSVIATSAAFLLLWVSSQYVFSKEIPGFKLSISHLLRILFCSGIFLALVIFLKSALKMNLYYEAAIVSLISFAVYFALGLFILKIVDMRIIKEILKGKLK